MMWSKCDDCGKIFEVMEWSQVLCDKCNDRKERK